MHARVTLLLVLTTLWAAASMTATAATVASTATPTATPTTTPTPTPSSSDDDRNGAAAHGVPTVEERRKRLEGLDPTTVSVMPQRDANHALLSPATQQAYEDALRAYYSYRKQGYDRRLQAFEWQAWSSKVIFVVVLLLVFVGIVFAALQFRAGLGGSGKPGELDTEFAVDLKGLRVRSPVLGVIVLTISLAFFYLYLVYVYPIFNVF